MKPKTRTQMLILAFVPLIMVLGNTMLFPVFPEMKEALGISQKELGWFTLAISLPSAFIAPLTGQFADKIGRKVIVIPSLLLYGLGGMLAGLLGVFGVPSFFWIMLARFLQGLGSGGPMHLSTVLAGDIFQSEERAKALGFIETANGVGKVLSPILGSLIGLFAWWAVFWVYPLLAFPLAFLFFRIIKEPEKKEEDQEKKPFRWHILTRKLNLIGLGSGFVSLFSLLGLMFWLSDFLDAHWHLPQVLRGLILAIPVAVAAIVSAFSYYLQRFGARLTLSLGLFFCALALCLLPPLASSFFLWTLLPLLGLGIGLILPSLSLLSTSLVAASERATLTSLYSAFRSIGAAIAPFTLSLLLPFGLYLTFLPLSFLLFGLAFSLWIFVTEQELPEKLRRKGRKKSE